MCVTQNLTIADTILRRSRVFANSRLVSTFLLHFIKLLFVVFSLVSVKRRFACVESSYLTADAFLWNDNRILDFFPAGFETVIADNPGKLMESQWMKLAVNSTINPLTAVLGVKNGDLIGSPDIQDISTKLAQEFMAVVKARNGFSFPLDNVDEVLKVVFDVANKTKLNTSSMLSDLNR